ncbi:hypothetical protein JN11_00513 [Mucilaginibacter frigoritolerans]|uniref:Zn-dependent peptidase ImmA (M78 family) n=1 Tax=Mucilaginibacter frigoritolerans TaxID=652788 RepID=A0A562UG25_9SPHI|nr:ImmA/IrrE family metallo-endopeptidase [Mucilaginibacter frigoritolerans]TWJ04792.1 hypothetical protein JN11_00513 [Mucilaginibacter frigoritolerans]
MLSGNDHDFANEIISRLQSAETLTDLFEKRISELNITPTNALEILEIEYRALQGILTATNKRVDYTNFPKLASFLKISKERVFSLYLNQLEINFPENTSSYPQNKIDFINSNFDLVTLRKAGFIQSITDYKHIEEKIVGRYGLKTIFEYRLPPNEIAFSAGLIKPKNTYTRAFWVNEAKEVFEEIDNPNDYDRDGLIKYFPEIRWQTTDVDKGLLCIIRDLYKLGVTVIYQSPFENLHLRGATMKVNGKPCVVLTDYKGFYATIFFGLCHELSHVLFDLDDLKHAHISDGETHDFSLDEKEKEANDFSREYLFSTDKLKQVRPYLNDTAFVKGYAEQNQVHASLIYTFNAFDKGDDRKAWARAQKNNPLSFKDMVSKIENPWKDGKLISEHVKFLRSEYNLYN